MALLRHVEFAFLSESKLGEFLDRVFPDLIDVSVWGSLCECVRRFCGSSAKAALRKAKRYRIEFETFTSDKGAFNGIVQHLRGECGGNPHEKGVISTTDGTITGTQKTNPTRGSSSTSNRGASAPATTASSLMDMAVIISFRGPSK